MKNKYITILAVLLPISAFAQVNLNNGLVANYTFSGNADDESGNALDGVVHGATLTSDRFGNSNSAYEFDGIKNCITVKYNNLLNMTGNKSLSLWYKINSNSLNDNPTLIHMIGSTYYPTFQLFQNNHYTYGSRQNKMTYFFGDDFDNYYATTTQLYTNYTNQWIHIVGTYSQVSGYIKIYFNGIISDSANVGNITSNSSSSDMQIGRFDSTVANTYYKGAIDEIRLYNRELNREEVDSLYRMHSNNALLTKINTKEIIIYPNPSKNSIAISVEHPSQVFLFDMKGSLLSQQNIDKSNNKVDLSSVPCGIYMVKVIEGNEIGIAKVIKQ